MKKDENVWKFKFCQIYSIIKEQQCEEPVWKIYTFHSLKSQEREEGNFRNMFYQILPFCLLAVFVILDFGKGFNLYFKIMKWLSVQQR